MAICIFRSDAGLIVVFNCTRLSLRVRTLRRHAHSPSPENNTGHNHSPIYNQHNFTPGLSSLGPAPTHSRPFIPLVASRHFVVIARRSRGNPVLSFLITYAPSPTLLTLHPPCHCEAKPWQSSLSFLFTYNKANTQIPVSRTRMTQKRNTKRKTAIRRFSPFQKLLYPNLC